LLKSPYTVIEGNIGSGKTTLAKMLAHRFHTRTVLESFAENTFLQRFYGDPPRYAFPLELSFLADRYNQLRQAWPSPGDRPVVSDYGFEKCLLFARVNLQGDELRLFEQFFRWMEPHVRRPGLLVYLKCTPEQALRNIGRRGRPFEAGIDPDYIRRLDAAYDEYIGSLEGIPVVTIDTAHVDFVNNPSDYLKIIAQVEAT
jgi:deoxyadenosine/deoxycytidine kinase